MAPQRFVFFFAGGPTSSSAISVDEEDEEEEVDVEVEADDVLSLESLERDVVVVVEADVEVIKVDEVARTRSLCNAASWVG